MNSLISRTNGATYPAVPGTRKESLTPWSRTGEGESRSFSRSALRIRHGAPGRTRCSLRQGRDDSKTVHLLRLPQGTTWSSLALYVPSFQD